MKNKSNLKGKSIKTREQQLKQKKPTALVENKSSNRWIWYALVFVLIITFVIYFNTLKFGFLDTWDDNLYIRDNISIKNLNWQNFKLFFSSISANNYQPILLFFYALEYKIGSGSASIFHFNNILFHILNTYLVFILTRKISPKSYIVALVTSAFFAVHPMHVESVAWVAETKDILYSFFFLLSLIMYTNYLNSHKSKFIIYAFVLFVLSCLSKSAAVILPLLMFLFDYYLVRKFDWKIIIEKFPFLIISLIFGLVAIYSQKGAIQDRAPDMSTIEHISIVSFSFMSYIFKVFIPFNLSAVYSYPIEFGSKFSVTYYLSTLVVLLLFYFVWYSRRWGRDIVFGFLFFIITIILVLQFVPVGGATMADRYTYIPYIGFFFIIGKLLEKLSVQLHSNKNLLKYASTFLIIVFIAFSTISFARVKVWENDDTLFSDTLSKFPNCGIAYRMRGIYFQHYHSKNKINKEDDLKKAATDYENSLKYIIVPKDNKGVYFNIGVIKAELGDVESAIQWYGKSIEVDPSFGKSYLNRGSCYMSYYVGKVYVNDKANKEVYLNKAIKDFENSLKHELSKEESAKAYFNLGIAKSQLSNYEGSLADFDKGIQIDSIAGGANIYAQRAVVKYQLKSYEGALKDFSKAIELNPEDSNSIKNKEIVKSILKKNKPNP